MTLPSPFEWIKGNSERLVTDLRTYAARGFPMSTPLRDAWAYGTHRPTNFGGNATAFVTNTMPFQAVIPGWMFPEDGWAVTTMHLLVGTTKTSAAGKPSLVVRARLRTAAGASTLGEFDSRRSTATPGVPFNLAPFARLDRAVPAMSSVEFLIEQNGWPYLSANDCTVSWAVARTGA